MNDIDKISGNILTPKGWVRGNLTIKDGIIDRIEDDDRITVSANYVLPGFIDLHVHGGGGLDIMQGGNAARILAQTHVRYGTTSLLATTMTAREDDIVQALQAIAVVMAEEGQGADILGVHLEGPFINADRLGAQPNHVICASKDLIKKFNAIAPLKIITLAPELSENMEIITWATQEDICVQIGHTNASYAQCLCAMDRGAKSFTHLYNAMSPLQHRQAGAVGAALAKGFYCEIIPDLVHVEEGALLAAMRAIPRLYGVTDGTAACGMPDGQYKLGENDVYKTGNAVRLKDGTLAGSTLTLDQALKNFVKLGDPLEQASKRLSQYQADYLGLTDRGCLEEGRRADIVTLDHDLTIEATYVAGRCQYQRI